MKAKKCKRKEAKVMYNMFLNSTDSDISDVKRTIFFTNICGYSEKAVETILDINNEKGMAYEKFTAIEKDVINKLIKELAPIYEDSVKVRRHDSLIVFNTDINFGELELTTGTEYNGNLIFVKTKIHVNEVIK